MAAPPPPPIRVTRTVRPVGGGFCPCWPEDAALALRHAAARRAAAAPALRARLRCYTTPAVTDAGGASVCLELEPSSPLPGAGHLPGAGPPRGDGQSAGVACLDLEDGGYVLGLRPEGSAAFLPAIAGVPGKQGLDRYGRSRVGLAECMVMARPLEGGLITFLHEEVLRAWLPEGRPVEVVPLARLTDFFLGLNAGTWLRFRILETAAAAKCWAEQEQAREATREPDGDALGQLLNGTGLVPAAEVEPPPPDASELWNFWGCGGNTGVSGQVTLPAGAADSEGIDDAAPCACPAGDAAHGGGAVETCNQDLGPTVADEELGPRFHFEHGDVRVSVEQWHSEARGGEVDLTGDLVWPTGFIFCRYLCDRAGMLRGRRVLDVGAGTGLVGLVAAALGAVVTLVDVPRVMPLLARNVAAAATASAGGSAEVAARSLWWGDLAAAESLLAERGPFDVVLCCEVVYQQTLRIQEALRQTLDAVLARPGGRIVFAYQHRDGAEVTDTNFFRSLTSSSGLWLVSEEPLDAWDDSWDEASFRSVRTYSAGEDVGR